MKDELIKEFRNRFHKEPERIFFCPGRINLIGEHIDYNGGSVMPCAISLGTYLGISSNVEKVFRFQSLNFPETAELDLQESYIKTGKEWFNYPLGVINELLNRGHELSGLDMLIYGNLPVAAGLSSSASIEVLTGFALNEIFNLHISREDIALLSRKVENEFIGVNCGIMDQFTVAMSKKDKAILLNCDTLDYKYLPFETGDYVLVIINSNKQRVLADSKYNERFIECRTALKLMKQSLHIENLCDVSVAEFEINQHLLDDRVLRKRARHVINENARVKDAEIALHTSNMEVFGKLMYASHQSLKELYEVSGEELDTIVDFCKTYEDCIGARMTGAGFGGCAIASVREECIDDFTGKLAGYYKDKIGYRPGIFTATAGDGVKEIMF